MIMNGVSSTTNIATLLGSAQADSTLSAGGFQALNLNDLGVQMQNGLGIHVDDVTVSEANFLNLVVDDSTSIQMGGNTPIVRDGVNSVLQALADSKQAGSFFVCITLLNGGVIQPFTPLVIKDPSDLKGQKMMLDPKLKLTTSNYRPSGGTPVIEKSIVALGTGAAKVQEFAAAGVPARAITLIISDGEATDRNKRASDVAPLARDLL